MKKDQLQKFQITQFEHTVFWSFVVVLVVVVVWNNPTNKQNKFDFWQRLCDGNNELHNIIHISQ